MEVDLLRTIISISPRELIGYNLFFYLLLYLGSASICLNIMALGSYYRKEIPSRRDIVYSLVWFYGAIKIIMKGTAWLLVNSKLKRFPTRYEELYKRAMGKTKKKD